MTTTSNQSHNFLNQKSLKDQVSKLSPKGFENLISMSKIIKRGKPSQKRRNNERAMNAFLVLIAFILLMMGATDAHASSFILSAKQPDISGVWAMLIIGGIAWFFCAKGMPKDVPSFDSEGILIVEETEEGGQDV